VIEVGDKFWGVFQVLHGFPGAVITHCHSTVEAQRGSEDCGLGGLGGEWRRLGGELLGASTELGYN